MVTNKPTPLPVLQVVFCGTVKAGKSTTLNSLLGANVLPSSAKVCTSKITVLKKSIDNKYRVVMGGSTQEFNDVKELLKYLIGVVGAGGTGYNETTYSCTTIVISKLVSIKLNKKLCGEIPFVLADSLRYISSWCNILND